MQPAETGSGPLPSIGEARSGEWQDAVPYFLMTVVPAMRSWRPRLSFRKAIIR